MVPGKIQVSSFPNQLEVPMFLPNRHNDTRREVFGEYAWLVPIREMSFPIVPVDLVVLLSNLQRLRRIGLYLVSRHRVVPCSAIFERLFKLHPTPWWMLE